MLQVCLTGLRSTIQALDMEMTLRELTPKQDGRFFGYPVFRKTGDKERVFYRNLEGFWCFRVGNQGVVNEHYCNTKVAVKSGKFPFIPPEVGWKYHYSGTNYRDDSNMRVVSHW